MASALQALLWRDLALARKQGGSLAAALSFILAVVVMVPLAIGPDLNLLQRLAAGMMWLALLLAVLLTADRIFQQDLEDGSLDLLTMSPVPFELITLTKALEVSSNAAAVRWCYCVRPQTVNSPPMTRLRKPSTSVDTWSSP